MTKSRRLPPAVVSAIRDGKMLAIRQGTGHRSSASGRSSSTGASSCDRGASSRGSWYRTFLDDPAGAIEVGTKTIPIRAVHTRSESLKDRISEAYLFKYPRRIRKLRRDLGRKRSRDATVELTPVR